MGSIDYYQSLEELEWAQIPESTYMIKSHFTEDGFSLIVSDLKDIFGEHLKEDGIQRKFSNSNPHAEMKTKVITKNLKLTLENVLAQKAKCNAITHAEEKLNIEIEFNVNQVSFIFNFEAVLLSKQKFQTHVVLPLLSHTLLTQQENIALRKKVSDLENKLNSTVSPQKPFLDYKFNSTAFNLLENNNVSPEIIMGAFFEFQNGMKSCMNERKAFLEHHRKRSQGSSQQQSNIPKMSVKREIAETQEPTEIKYEDEAELRSSQKLDVKPSIPACQIVKSKKKKNFKF